jgi:hypothetical protein
MYRLGLGLLNEKKKLRDKFEGVNRMAESFKKGKKIVL